MDRKRQWHWIVGSLFPRPTFMRWRYHARADWQLPFLYIHRWSEITRDVSQTGVKWACTKLRI